MLINDNRAFKRSLDEQTAAQQKLHLEALDRALAKHEEVRTSAERARERVELELEKERRRREDEERKAVEKARRDLEDQERQRQLDEQRAREEERKRQETLRREQDDAERREEAQKQQEQEAKASRDRQVKEDADRRAQQEAEAKANADQAEKEKQKAPQQSQAPRLQLNGAASSGPSASTGAVPTAPSQSSQIPTTIPQGLVSTLEDRQSIHNRYLDLHKRLKQMRAHVLEECKKVPGLKNQVSEWRRAIQKCCGQLSKGTSEEAKANNRRAVSKPPQSPNRVLLHANFTQRQTKSSNSSTPPPKSPRQA